MRAECQSSTLWDVWVRKECCAACGSALQTVHLLSTCSTWCWVYITALGPPRSRSRCLSPKPGAGPTSTLEVGGRKVEPANIYLCECSKPTYSCLGACVCMCVCVCVCVYSSLSHVQLFATPWAIACLAPLSMEFSRQEYWSG